MLKQDTNLEEWFGYLMDKWMELISITFYLDSSLEIYYRSGTKYPSTIVYAILQNCRYKLNCRTKVRINQLSNGVVGLIIYYCWLIATFDS